MVSKITVMALVALVAVPIGLGYALNFQDVEHTGYEVGKTTNITELIRTGTATNYTQADSYALNTYAFQDAYFSGNPVTQPTIPRYVSESKTAGSLSYVHVKSLPTIDPQNPDAAQIPWVVCYTNVTVPSSTLQLRLTLTFSDNTTRVINNPVSIVINYDLPYESNENVKMQILYYSTTGYMFGDSYTNVKSWTWASYNGYDITKADQYFYRVNRLDDSRMVTPNLAQGFSLTNFIRTNGDSIAATYWTPGNTPFKDVLLTFDMSQMSGHAALNMVIVNQYGDLFRERNLIHIINDGDTHSIAGQDIIYNAGQPNVYQLWIKETGYELRYVGGWPTSFGEANYYRSWTIPYYSENVENPLSISDNFLISKLAIGSPLVPGGGITERYPFTFGKMRFDAAALKSNTVPVISNATIDPTKILGQNQTQTKITALFAVGNTIGFGDRTFTVNNDNKLIVDNVPIKLNDLKFDSVLNEQSGYDNRINGYVVSTTQDPSTIKLNGTWKGTSVSIAPLTAVTSTESKWIPGGWAWDGVGTSFAVVGLITCLGVFVGLGMYGRRSGSKVGGLMLVCAGGALIFLSIM